MIERDGKVCWICRKAFADGEVITLDHVVPKSKGGKDAILNLRPAHKSCNRRRGNGD